MNEYKNIKTRKAHNLKRIREKFNLKQRQIAEIINMRESNVSDMENCRRTITDKVIEKISIKLNIDPAEFFYTPELPIIVDKTEKEYLALYKEAEKHNISSDLIRFAKWRITESQVEKNQFQEEHRTVKKQKRQKTI